MANIINRFQDACVTFIEPAMQDYKNKLRSDNCLGLIENRSSRLRKGQSGIYMLLTCGNHNPAVISFYVKKGAEEVFYRVKEAGETQPLLLEEYDFERVKDKSFIKDKLSDAFELLG